MSEVVKKELDLKENIKPAKLTLLKTNDDFVKFPYLKETVDLVYKTIESMKENFVYLGYLLTKLKSDKDIREIFNDEKGRPCKDVYEFAKIKFNLSPTMTKKFIGIYLRFGYSGGSLIDEFKPYSQTQLEEMLPLTDKQLELVNPKMTVQEIRALKKVVKVSPLTDQKTTSEQNCGYEQGVTLKNDSQRLDFFRRYKEWGVWLTVPELSMKFYKCLFNNGDFALVTEVAFERKNYEGKQETLYTSHFQIVRAGTGAVQYYSSNHYSFSAYSGSQICDYFKETKAKVLFNYVPPVEKK